MHPIGVLCVPLGGGFVHWMLRSAFTCTVSTVSTALRSAAMAERLVVSVEGARHLPTTQPPPAHVPLRLKKGA